ncbi:MAPEG family protein [Rhodanobacter ginsengisoli]|uniref:MAPEG family protein n=1 Tax=Rhodanobacter ginsengisoli TaxID=418646 RepID=A0ABW0QJT4_9GAMM
MIPFEIRVLGFGVLLGFAHIVLASHSASLQRGYRWTAGARDEPVAPLAGTAARLARALANFCETFPFFAALALAVVLADRVGLVSRWGAGLYITGRILYLPLYAFGVPLVRSLAWNVSAAGILLLAFALLRG